MAKTKMTFSDFLDKQSNEDLFEEYALATGEDIWAINPADVDALVEQINNNLSISFSSIVTNSLRICINTNRTLLDVLDGFVATKTVFATNDNSIQRYFQDIGKIYSDNNNDYNIEFTPENREKIICMNLKSVIAIAKGYQGLGVELPDLISAGNEGLCRAYAKYDPSRANLKNNIVDATSSLNDEFTYDELKEMMDKYLTYGDIRKKFTKAFKPNMKYNRSDLKQWIDKNVHNAKFNSVACMWILAYIINEINTNSRLVKKPKSEIDRDREETGYYVREKRLDIDAPVSPNSDATIGEILDIHDDEIDEFEKDESYRVFKKGLDVLLTGVRSRDRRILLKRFGIGLPRPMEPNEIAHVEDLSVARISQIIQSTIRTMKLNYEKYDVDPNIMFEALSKIK